MPVLWRTQLAFVIFNIFLVVLFVVANRDFCGSVFETQVDHALLGHVMDSAVVMDEFECQLKCMGNNSCKSCNVLPGKSNGNRICELNNKTWQMKPGDLKPRKGSTYYGSVQVSCIDDSNGRNGQTKSGQCHPGYKGTRCQKPPALNVFIRSEGCEDPGRTPPFGIAYIKVNGKDYSRHLRGHNVVVSSLTGAVLDSKAFDTYGDSSAGNHLRDYLNSINGSKIVLVAIQDEGSTHVAPAITALKRVGATPDLLSLTDYRGSFALVGYAGVNKPPWIAQQSAKRGKGPSEISLKIPSPTAIKGLYYNQPAHSCKDIRDSGVYQKDGEYWIDPEKNGKPFKVFCDMTTDGGGWLLVSNVVIDDPSSRQFSVESSYRRISNCHNNKTLFLTTSAMNELRTHLSFTQLRFRCSTKHGRTFHVTTAANSTGEAVVQYFSGQTDVRPDACGSFVRMKDDNSGLAGACKQWRDQKWGFWSSNEDRLYNHAAYVSGTYHWLLTPGGSRWECDDLNVGVSSGDFWKVFVR